MLFPRSLLVSLFLIFLAVGVTQSSELPDLGQSSEVYITPTQEKKLGKIFLKKIKQKYKIIEDPIVVDYIQSLGERLASNSGSLNKEYSFYVIDNPEINAFAGPDGLIGIYTGLIFATEAEGELAAILAHEIAHISQRHLIRKLESSGFFSISNTGMIIASGALGFLVDRNAGRAAMIGSQAALLQKKLAYSRSIEREADRVSINILADTKFDPRSLPAVFERIKKKSGSYGSKLPQILLTHPVDDERIADAMSRTHKFPYIQRNNELRYEILLAYLKHKRQINQEISLNLINDQLREGKYRNRSAKELQKVLTLQQMGKFRDAENIIKNLISKHPNVTEFKIIRALGLAHSNEVDKALSSLEKAIIFMPVNYSMNMTLAEIAISRKRFKFALKHLERYQSINPNTPQIYQLIAQAQSGLGNLFKAYTNNAKYKYLTGDLASAIQQQEYALTNFNADFHDLTKAESKLREYKEELKLKK